MKGAFFEKLPSYWKKLSDKYKYVILIGLLGLALMLWPQGAKAEPAASAPPEEAAWQEELSRTEARLEEILSRIEGVGRVKVMLTLKSGAETVYAYDTSEARSQGESGGSASRQEELVTLSEGGRQSPVERVQLSPVFQGAAVVCQGGDSAAVRLCVTQVVQSLTGITTDHIVITKMKE